MICNEIFITTKSRRTRRGTFCRRRSSCRGVFGESGGAFDDVVGTASGLAVDAAEVESEEAEGEELDAAEKDQGGEGEVSDLHGVADDGCKEHSGEDEGRGGGEEDPEGEYGREGDPREGHDCD